MPLQERPRQQPAQALCMLRSQWTLQAGWGVDKSAPGTAMRHWHSKGLSHAPHAGAGSLRRLLQMTLPQCLGGGAWQRPGGPAGPPPHPLQSPRTPSPAAGTATCLPGLFGWGVPCGIMWGTAPAPDHEAQVRGSCAPHSTRQAGGATSHQALAISDCATPCKRSAAAQAALHISLEALRGGAPSRPPSTATASPNRLQLADRQHDSFASLAMQ